MRTRWTRRVAAPVVGALLVSIAGQTPSFAATPSLARGGSAVVHTVKDLFSGGQAAPKPPVGPKDAIADRQKLPRGVKAPAAHRVKEFTNRRTPSAQYWKLSDGTTQAEVSAVPLSYRTSSGDWKAIDPTVTASTRADYPLANTTNLSRTYFGSRSGSLLHFEADATHTVTLGLAGAGKPAKPVAKGNTVTYPALAGGSDVTYRVGRGGVMEDITLAKRPAGPVSYAFTLNTQGLTPQARRDGSIALYGGDERGGPRLVIPAATMMQAPKNTDTTVVDLTYGKVTQTLTKAGTAWRVTLTPDAKWLAAPDRRFPVTVDPTIVIAPTPTTGQDVMVDSSQPDTNLNGVGTSTTGNWQLGVGTTATAKLRSLVQFPLPAIPAGTHIDAARLGLYYNQAHTSNANSVTIEAHRATSAWTSTGATWNSTSALSGELSGTTVQLDDGDAGTAAKGAWPYSTNTAYTQYGINGDYAYNKDTVAGDTYTWQPTVPETASYRVDVHTIPASDRATNAPYAVTYNGGTYNTTVDQSAGTGGVWTSLNGGTALSFAKGTAGKVVLGDGPASTTTSVIADAVRLVDPGSVIKSAGAYDKWHSFPVTDTVQKWVDGTAANDGFVVQAHDETTMSQGGPLYEAAEFGYGGETATYPTLTLTYGTPGVAVNAPTTIHATGADLTWPAYVDPTPGTDTSDDLAEYQVHRSVFQGFTPSSATLVSPVAATTTSFSDTTAAPTAADATNPFHAVYYEVAVKTRGGQVIGGPVQLAELPKAGQTSQIIQSGQTDTTLSSAQPTAAHDTIVSDSVNQNWLTIGNNSATYGKTRAVMKFPTTTLPATARVISAQVQAFSTITTNTGGGSAIYELHPLTKDFDEATATWTNATSTTAWTTAGGDYAATASDTVTGVSNDPVRHYWDATSTTQGWINTPTSNHGVLLKVKDETTSGPQERSVFTSSETSEPQLRPQLDVTYVDATTDSTYYAPSVPARMTPGTTYNVDVSLTNTTNTTWAPASQVLSYKWTLPDGTDVTNGGNQIQTALPSDIVPGQTVTLHAQVKAPTNADSGQPTNKRTAYTLTWDVFNKTNASWNSATGGVAGLAQAETIEDPTSDRIGLEKFYSYAGKNTGAGSSVMTNLASGNAVWSYDAVANPGRGLGTFVRFAYNSLDTSDTVLGPGWSSQASAPVRLGAALDFHPNPSPTTVTLTDGDGTASVFTKQADGTFKAPAGVHYLLAAKGGVTCTPDKDDTSDAWSMTKPDGTRFFYDCDGYPTSIVDKNGNTETFTYATRRSNNKPVKFLQYITDPAGRQTLTVTYYSKGDAYSYVDDAGAVQSGTNLTSPKIIDHLASMTDISGRKVTFLYTTQGLMAQLTDGAGSSQPKVFGFTYDATQGTKNVKLVKITDPRGHATSLAYYAPQSGDNPTYHWWAKTFTDRLSHATSFGYAADTTTPAFTDTTVTDAASHATAYVTDDFGRPVQTTNAKSQVTKLSWDADDNVIQQVEDNGATTKWTYDPKTGYPLTATDAEAVRNGWPSTVYTYQTRIDGYSADLYTKTSPEGRGWLFGYDTYGNLTSVTDPKGVSTSTAGDYTTSYAYDSSGELTAATDAGQHTTRYSGFDPNGYPRTTTNALGKSSSSTYDVRGEVLSVTDPLSHTITQNYDVYGRPLDKKVPRDQAAGVYITAPAAVYDANDNVVQSTAPNGAVSTAVYDNADEVTSATAPKEHTTDPDRTTSYTYDLIGELKTTTEPKGTLTTSDPADYTTTSAYDTIGELTDVTNADNKKVSYQYDNVGNATEVIAPVKNATADTTDFTTQTAFDLDHRPIQATDGAGKVTRTGYDKDGLRTTSTDADNNTTTTSYDERGEVAQVQTPYQGAAGSPSFRTTKYGYDQVGNATQVFSPRSVAAGSTTAFVRRTSYDELNRPVRQYQPYDPSDARYNDANVYSETVYDDAGRVSKTSAPPSNGQTVRNDTTYTHYDDGHTKTATDPWSLTTAYDYNELGEQTSRTLTSAGGSSSRTMGWSYYQDGNLSARTDDGVPVGSQVVLVDNSDSQNATATGTWATASTGDPATEQGYDYRTHAAGSGTDAFTWHLNIPQDGTYTVYAKYPQVTGAATAASYSVTHDGTSTPKTVNQTTGANTWVSLGSYTFTQGNASTVALTQNTGGTVTADAVKLVRDNSADTDNEKHASAYTYDPNGNLTQIGDSSPGAAIDTYGIAYTGLNQIAEVTESAGGTEKTHTAYTYDPDGQISTVDHPGQYSTYSYDLRELVQSVKVGDSATDPAPKTTSYTYTARGQQLRQTKGNGNTVDFTYWPSGEDHTQTEKTSAGTLVDDHTLTWDANGSKAEDIASKQNADSHSAYLSSTTDYTYDPADRLANAVKTGNGAGTETYVHDANANVVTQTVGGTATTYTYDRNRLLSSVVGSSSAAYDYDPYGRLSTITSAGTVIERNTYDGFDHITKNTKVGAGGTSTTTSYTFDPLDRTTSKTTGGKTTDFAYLGLSGQVLDETVAGQLAKSYQYSPWGGRLSQITHSTDGTTSDGYYGYNSHSDVETLTDGSGNTKATYGYSAYGADDKSEFTGIDKPDAQDPTKEPYNAYRFNAKRWDATAGTYDMGFRTYDPGLNRFTSRDMYNGALADMGLSTDPLTGNRYAFGGGNPTTNIELDGHDNWWADPTMNKPTSSDSAPISQSLANEEGLGANCTAENCSGYDPIANPTYAKAAAAEAAKAQEAYGADVYTAKVTGVNTVAHVIAVQDEKFETQDYLAAAQRVRDGVLAQLRELQESGAISTRQFKSFTTITAAWDEKTGNIYVAALKSPNKGRSEFCAEDLCDLEAVKNGSAKEDLQFTEAIRPRDGRTVDICVRCQGTHELDQFKESGANFEPGGRLALQQGSNSALAQAEAEELAEAEAEAMAEGMAMGLEDE